MLKRIKFTPKTTTFVCGRQSSKVEIAALKSQNLGCQEVIEMSAQVLPKSELVVRVANGFEEAANCLGEDR